MCYNNFQYGPFWLQMHPEPGRAINWDATRQSEQHLSALLENCSGSKQALVIPVLSAGRYARYPCKGVDSEHGKIRKTKPAGAAPESMV